MVASERALACNDEDEFRALALGLTQKSHQLGVRLCLRLAVEIDSGIDFHAAASELLFLPPLDRLDLRRGLSNGRSRHFGSSCRRARRTHRS
jgi:hypothetical protein